MSLITKTFLSLLCLLAQDAFAQSAAPSAGPHQDKEAIRQNVEQFLHTQTAGLPGRVNIKVGQIDARLNLPACAAPEPFLPNGSRAWGRTTVGVRCTEPAAWTMYVSATVQVLSEYIAVAAPLAQGQVIGTKDIVKTSGDLAALPPGIITDATQAIGRTVASSLKAGSPLRHDVLRNQQAVQQGQTVRVISAGNGFQVSTEARALTNASEGQVTQARTASGQVVSGVAKMGGILEISY